MLFFCSMFLFFAAEVMGLACFSDADTIIRLSSENNAHLGLWNDTSYTVPICFSRIFGVVGTGNRTCAPLHEVVSLSNFSNAHGEVPEQNNYLIPVCYGMQCVSTLGSCAIGYKPVLKLSGNTNAHAGLANSSYPVTICCTPHPIACADGADNDNDGLIDLQDPHCTDSTDLIEDPGTPCADGVDNDNDGLVDILDPDCWTDPTDPSTYDPNIIQEGPGGGGGQVLVSNAYWANNIGQRINESHVKDLVQLVVVGSGLSGKQINYTIMKTVPFWFDQKINPDTIGGVVKWRAGDNGSGIFETGDYYFLVDVAGAPRFSTDDISELHVFAGQDNQRPVAVITAPQDKQIYFIGEEIKFNQASYDVDDEFAYVWSLENGTHLSGESTAKVNWNFTHTYATAGQKTIVLRVIDERDETNDDIISILVINGNESNGNINEKYILSYIDEPEKGRSFGRKVKFNATGTFAIETSLQAGLSVTCLAGLCPPKILGCYNGQCDVPIQNSPTSFNTANYNPINFTWIFDGNAAAPREGSGLAGVLFDETFPRNGRHTVTLTAQINPTSTYDAYFDVFFDNPTCVVVDENNKQYYPQGYLGQSYWASSDSVLTGSQLDCYRDEGVDQDGEEMQQCCPNGFYCNEGNGVCSYTGKTYCNEFGQSECSGHQEVASAELDELDNLVGNFPNGCSYYEQYGDRCAEYIFCGCEWRDNTCQAISSHKVQNWTSASLPAPIWDYSNLPANIGALCNAGSDVAQSGKCTFNFAYVGDCGTGDEFVQRSWTVYWDGQAGQPPAYCVDGADTISCGNVVKLSFFGLWQFVLVILCLAGLYFFGFFRARKK